MNLHERVQSIRDGIQIATLISIPLTTLVTFVFFGIWAIYGERIITKTRSELGIDRNYELILRSLGEDRVIRQPMGLSYVEEPVHIGEDIIINLTLARTQWGKECVYQNGNAVFITPNGITVGGSDLPPIRQFNQDTSRFRLSIDHPTFEGRGSVSAGRWAVYTILNYECYGEKVVEETYAMDFYIQEKQE